MTGDSDKINVSLKPATETTPGQGFSPRGTSTFKYESATGPASEDSERRARLIKFGAIGGVTLLCIIIAIVAGVLYSNGSDAEQPANTEIVPPAELADQIIQNTESISPQQSAHLRENIEKLAKAQHVKLVEKDTLLKELELKKKEAEEAARQKQQAEAEAKQKELDLLRAIETASTEEDKTKLKKELEELRAKTGEMKKQMDAQVEATGSKLLDVSNRVVVVKSDVIKNKEELLKQAQEAKADDEVIVRMQSELENLRKDLAETKAEVDSSVLRRKRSQVLFIRSMIVSGILLGILIITVVTLLIVAFKMYPGGTQTGFAPIDDFTRWLFNLFGGGQQKVGGVDTLLSKEPVTIATRPTSPPTGTNAGTHSGV